MVNSKQIGGDHYKRWGSMQPWDIIDHYGLDFYEGSALTYLLRWRNKNGVEDLCKCKHYLEKLIEDNTTAPVQSIIEADHNPYETWTKVVDSIKNANAS